MATALIQGLTTVSATLMHRVVLILTTSIKKWSGRVWTISVMILEVVSNNELDGLSTELPGVRSIHFKKLIISNSLVDSLCYKNCVPFPFLS